MTHAYDELYLDKARTSLARMLDFAVHDLHYDISDFFDLFIATGIADLFGSGDVNTLVGRSGVELTYEVLDRSGLPYDRIAPGYSYDRSEEYWTGWALAYYQWDSALSFAEIARYVPVTVIQALYYPYHEMDIRQFTDRMNELIRDAKHTTNLKMLRIRAGLSQSGLASASGVPFRTIQQYEQCQKNINKAQAEYLVMLSAALGCAPSDLMERV